MSDTIFRPTAQEKVRPRVQPAATNKNRSIHIMKPTTLILALASLFIARTLPAQTPSLINYQGLVAVGTPAVNFNGTGKFKFTIESSFQNPGATAYANVNAAPTGPIISVTLLNGGSNYTSPPAVTFTDAPLPPGDQPGSGAVATAVLSSCVVAQHPLFRTIRPVSDTSRGSRSLTAAVVTTVECR